MKAVLRQTLLFSVVLAICQWGSSFAGTAKHERLFPSPQLLKEREQAVKKTVSTSGERSPSELSFALNLYEVSEAIDDLFALHPDEKGGGEVTIVIRPDGTVADCWELNSPMPVTKGFKRDFCAFLARVNFGRKDAQTFNLRLPIGIHERAKPRDG